MALIDVVIPMYNSENYIDGLIQTLENQTFKDFCAIFVDDGSKDKTYTVLCDKLQSVNFEYKVIHQENKGLPGARNTGIRNAHAEWIVFIDSDDGLDKYHLDYMYRMVKQTECKVGVCDYQIVSSVEQIREVTEAEFDFKKLTSLEIIQKYYKKWFGAWALILEREWLERKNLLFDEECTYLEDVPFITQVLIRAEDAAVTEAPLYLYYQRAGSLMNTPKIEKYQIAVNGFYRMEEVLMDCESESAREFRSMGRARYFLATLRKGAVLMPYAQFAKLCDFVPLEKEKKQFAKLQSKQKLAAYVYLFSKRLFYYAMRLTTA